VNYIDKTNQLPDITVCVVHVHFLIPCFTLTCINKTFTSRKQTITVSLGSKALLLWRIGRPGGSNSRGTVYCYEAVIHSSYGRGHLAAGPSSAVIRENKIVEVDVGNIEWKWDL